MPLFTAITTIQPPTDCVISLSNRVQACNGTLVVAGDSKGPSAYDLPNCKFLDIAGQEALQFSITDELPKKHYARKNVAYLYAIREGASCIYETDDDNRPNAEWSPRQETIESALSVDADQGWVNVYRYFTDENIWPRGLPLDCIANDVPETKRASSPLQCPIQQGLVNNSPDVDAIWRLVMDRPFDFSDKKSTTVCLQQGSWCPFNTQSTWWWPVAYPLLYIPSYCSFRMCDIWKSFVAQRCLWELGCGIAFHPPEVIQDRNQHDLAKDFEDEIPGYTLNNKIRSILEGCNLQLGVENVSNNLVTCYEELSRNGIFPHEEISLVLRWRSDVQNAMAGCEN